MATDLAVHQLREVGSTQNEARSLASATGRIPLLVISQSQTEGRGRSGRTWLTAPRAVACSLVVKLPGPLEARGPLPLVAGLAARRAIRDVAGVATRLKWPNDLVVEAGKVGGILVESSGDVGVVGFGLNMWWPDPPAGMTALLASDPGAGLSADVAETWARSLLRRLENVDSDWGRAEYVAACATIGTDVTWDPGGRGRAVDIGGDGGLVVETANGIEILRSGEVHAVRPATLAGEPPTTAEGNSR